MLTHPTVTSVTLHSPDGQSERLSVVEGVVVDVAVRPVDIPTDGTWLAGIDGEWVAITAPDLTACQPTAAPPETPDPMAVALDEVEASIAAMDTATTILGLRSRTKAALRQLVSVATRERPTSW